MRNSVAAAGAVACALVMIDAGPALAHRLDEYLEATTIQLSRESVRVDLRLAPGVAVATTVLDSIDVNHDGVISPAEESAYATVVMNDLSVAVDGQPVTLHSVSHRFPGVAALRDGTGEIHLAFDGELSAGTNHHVLTFDNRHRMGIAAYLVNAVIPDDPGIQITKQVRNFTQSDYEMAFDESGVGARVISFDVLGRWMFVALAVLAMGAGGAKQIRCIVSGGGVHHPSRSATLGSTRDARRAGK